MCVPSIVWSGLRLSQSSDLRVCGCCSEVDPSLFSSEVSPGDHKKLFKVDFPMFSLSGPPRISWFPGAPLFRHSARNPGLSITLSHISCNSTQGWPHVLRKVDLIQAGLCVYMCSIIAFIWLMSVGHSSDQRGKFFSITVLGSCESHCCHHHQRIFWGTDVRNGEKKWGISAHSLRIRRIASLPLSLLLVSSLPDSAQCPLVGFKLSGGQTGRHQRK